MELTNYTVVPDAYLHAADGLPLRYRTWRTPCSPVRGTVLFLTGRSEFIEKYSEAIDRIIQNGFDLFSFDWRGQGLSGRMLDDPVMGYVDCYDQYISDLDRVLQRIVMHQQRGPLHLLAHSMGAHIALRYLASNSPTPIAKAVFTSPMIDIVTSPAPPWFVRWLCRMMTEAGFKSRKLIGSGRFNPYKKPFCRNRLTSDPKRFDRVQQMVAQNPNLAVGGITYGWLAATFDSIDYLQHSANVGRFEIPTLIMMAGNDHVVLNSATQQLVRKMANCRIEVIPGARHEILQEQNHLQDLFWRAFDRFLNFD